jgi:hypothetical protein
MLAKGKRRVVLAPVQNVWSLPIYFSDFRAKGGHKPAFIGRANDRMEFCMWICSLPNRFRGTHRRATVRRPIRYDHHVDITMPPFSVSPTTPRRHPKLPPAFQVIYDHAFDHWVVHVLLNDPEQLNCPDVMVTQSEKKGYQWCMRFRRDSGPVLDLERIPDGLTRHPFYVMRYVMGHVSLSGEDGVFRRYFSPRLEQLEQRRVVNHAWRSRFGEFLLEQTGGSVRVLWSDATNTKMVSIQNEAGDPFALYGFTVVLPWARDVLRQATCMVTDSTFEILRDYTLAMLFCVVANESVAISLSVSPTESAGIYERMYDQLEALLPSETTPQPAQAVLTPENAKTVAARDEDFTDKGEELDRARLVEEQRQNGQGVGGNDIDDGVDLQLSDDDEEIPPDHGEPVFPEAQPVPTVEFLRSLPIVTDMGTALSSFVSKRKLNWKLCHFHILRAVGKRSRVAVWVNRLLRCNSEEEYNEVKPVIEKEIADAYPNQHYPDNIRWIDAMLHQGEPKYDTEHKCLLADISRWARWLRPGCPLTSNSAEATNGRLNQAGAGIRDFFIRLGIVIECLRERYQTRNSWCDRALRRNWFKCYPTDNQKNGYRFWQARADFYRKLHTPRGLRQPCLRRKFPDEDPRLLVPLTYASHRTDLTTPPSFQLKEVDQPDLRHLVLGMNGAFFTELDRKMVDIAWEFRATLAYAKWRDNSMPIVRLIREVAAELEIPTDGIPGDLEARWRSLCHVRVAELVARPHQK